MVSQQIKKAREKTGLSQEDLAKRLGVHVVTLSRWERGATRPRISILKRLAKVLRVDVEELLP